MNRLKELRKEKGDNQSAIASLLGVNVKTVSRWEKGENEIKLAQANMLANHFGVSVEYLLGYRNDKRGAKSINKLENIYVEFLENIDTISDIDLEDLKTFSNSLYEMAIAEKTRRLYEGNNEI